MDILDGIYNGLGAITPILYALVVAAVLDFVSGVLAAWRSGTLDGAYIPDWLVSHVDKVARVLLVLVAGLLMGGIDTAQGAALIALGSVAAFAYLAGVMTSIADNLGDMKDRTKGIPSTRMLPVLEEIDAGPAGYVRPGGAPTPS